MIILFSVVILIFLGISIAPARSFFLLLLPLWFLFTLTVVFLSPKKEKSHSDTPFIVQQHHKACECRYHRDFEPSQRKIELIVPKDSTVDAQVTSEDNTVNLINL